MNMRIYFNIQSGLVLLLAPLILLSLASIEFTKRPLLNSAGYQLTPQFFKFISAGYWPATGDLMWMNTLQRISTANYKPETLTDTLDFYRLITDLDPNFYEIYDQAAIVFGFFYESAPAAIEILDKGIQVFEGGHTPAAFWTHPFSLYLYRAYVNAFLKNDWAAAKSDYLKVASIPGSPAYLQKMKIWLIEDGSEKQLAIRVLKVLLNTTQDPIVRAKYAEKLKKYE